ncbi:S8 family peptidase [Bergeyella sp. RCAD1439]|uniref:S8 family peptidase n=1 Tax=Bergeyella anatis TaxID=3113737 RepID=UPI002E183BE2|nr:S8 family peptidase [Bergeyella sp. RCAD1439]
MKNTLLAFLGLGLSCHVQAQKQSPLHRAFERQYQDNLQKLSVYLNQNTRRAPDTDSLKILTQRLATFVNGAPLLWTSEDVQANTASNLPLLQNGTLAGLSSPIDGAGVRILIMDTGAIFEKHKEFADPSRIAFMETDPMTYSPHSTIVAGLIGAKGMISTAKGVLTNVVFQNYSFGNTRLGTNYQKLEAASDANISNHSYGTNLGWSKSGNAWYWYGDYELYKKTKQDTYSGSYHELDANYDKIVYANPNHIVIKSSGNYYGLAPSSGETKYRIDNATGNYVPFASGEEIPPANCSKGSYCIGWGALAKNIITVGAANQITTENNTYTQSTDVTRWANSTAGPRKDGAVKPDLVAVGQNLYAPSYASENSINSYSTDSGTSLSAAVVSGIAGALTQVQRQISGNDAFVFQADEMKALLLHTANDAGNTGPDVWYGWGLADARKAAEVLIGKKAGNSIFEQRTLGNGQTDNFEILAGTSPLKVTISWVDPAAVPFTTSEDLQNNTASRLVNDLDLRLIDTVTGAVYYPWKLSLEDPLAEATKGDNTVDNVEQVVVDQPFVGRKYRVEITHKGQLVDAEGRSTTSSKYSVVATGYQTMDGLSSDCEAITVYPTQTKDYTTVIVPMKGESITVYDTSGRRVSDIRMPNSQTLDVSSLKSGVYLINVKTPYCNKTKKILKL